MSLIRAVRRMDDQRVSRSDNVSPVNRDSMVYNMPDGGSMRYIAIPRTVFELEGGSATVNVIPLATRIDSGPWVSAAVTVRLHDKDWTTGTAAFTVDVENVSYTADEPSVAYLGSSLASVAVAVGDAAPKLYVAAFSGAIGDQVRVVLKYTQGGTAGLKTFAISVEIEARDA